MVFLETKQNDAFQYGLALDFKVWKFKSQWRNPPISLEYNDWTNMTHWIMIHEEWKESLLFQI